MKKFLVVTPQLSEEMLMEHRYVPAENNILEYKPALFPVIPLINGYTYKDEDEKIEIITVTYDTPHCHRNLKLLEQEIDSICAPKNIDHTLTSIEVPFDDSLQAILDIYFKLISHLKDNDTLFADITFGSKPMPIVLIMALQYAYRTKRNVTIECVTYGQISHHKETKDAKLFDVTALVQLDEIVRLIAERNVANPGSVIKQIIAV